MLRSCWVSHSLYLAYVTVSRDDMKNIKWQFVKRNASRFLLALVFLGILVIVAIPFIANPPGYVAAHRNLGHIYSIAAGESDYDVLEDKEGEVLLAGRVALCPQCNRPFIWFTRPKDGSVILLNQSEKPDHPKKFFVACEKPHSNGARWFLFNDRTRALLKDGEVDWESQNVVNP